MAAPCGGGRRGAASVSYTHLDVYKRQRETIDFLLNREEAHNTMFREAFNKIQDSGSQKDWGTTADSRIYFDLSRPGGQSFDPAKSQPTAFKI